MPVQAATMRAMSSASTSSLSRRSAAGSFWASASSCCPQPLLELDLAAVLQLCRLAVVGGPLRGLDVHLERLELRLGLAQGTDGALLLRPSGS